MLATIGGTNRTDVPLVAGAARRSSTRCSRPRTGTSTPSRASRRPASCGRCAVDLRGGDVTQGGSTITQQYAKNAYLSPQRSLTRKLKEILIATKLGQTRSKSTILEDYLNTIYFGRGAYGIEAASQAYFGVGSAQLTVAQGALLAAVIRGPGLLRPAGHRERAAKANAVARWHYVINGMVKEGWLSFAARPSR